MLDEIKNVQTTPPAPTASAAGLCPTLIQISKTHRYCRLTQHNRTTRPPHKFSKKMSYSGGLKPFVVTFFHRKTGVVYLIVDLLEEIWYTRWKCVKIESKCGEHISFSIICHVCKCVRNIGLAV